MYMTKSSLIALALAAPALASAAPFVEDQHEATGLFVDDTLNLTLRNYYFNRDKNHGGGNVPDPDKASGYKNGYTESWAQAFLLRYESGFTQGPVGIGMDAFGHAGLKLDSSKGRSGSQDLVMHSDGNAADQFGRAGGAVKLRVSKTLLKFGDLQPATPVFAVGGTRMIPQTANGISLMSSEIDGLDLEAGHFTSATPGDSTNRSSELYLLYAGIPFRSADYLGGVYTFSDNLNFSLYGAEYADIWRQYFGNVNYTLPLPDDQALNVDFSVFRTSDTGERKAGDIDNTTFSLATTYTTGIHTLTLAYQYVSGDTPFDYLGLDNANLADILKLANSSQYSDFNGPREKSWKIEYGVDMSGYGISGLDLMARYVRGSGADGTHIDADSPYNYGFDKDGKHRETDIQARYTVQSSFAKDLSITLRQAWHRVNHDYPDDNLNETLTCPDFFGPE